MEEDAGEKGPGAVKNRTIDWCGDREGHESMFSVTYSSVTVGFGRRVLQQVGGTWKSLKSLTDNIFDGYQVCKEAKHEIYCVLRCTYCKD